MLLAAYAGCITTRCGPLWAAIVCACGPVLALSAPSADCRLLLCLCCRRASQRAFAKQRRSMGATDLLAELGAVADDLAEGR